MCTIMTEMKVDSLDKRIIKMLEQDASQSREALAKQLEVNPSTIRRRIGKLVEHRVIRISAVCNSKRIGFPFTTIIAFDVAPGMVDSVFEKLSVRQEVSWLFVTSGVFDIIAIARFAGTDEIIGFVEKELAMVKGIENIEIFVVLQTINVAS